MKALSILVFAISSVILPSTPQHTTAQISISKPTYLIDLPSGTNQKTKDRLLLEEQMRKHPKLPPISFWEAVAWCETHQEWDRGKDWGPNARAWVSGGLGLAHTTWRGYGGRQFASKAAKASKWAQIIVANRVGFLGFQTRHVYMTFEDKMNKRPYYRPAAGFGKIGHGWGGTCRKAWIKKHGLDN